MTRPKTPNSRNGLQNPAKWEANAAFGVVFTALYFAFSILFAPHNAYMGRINERPHSIMRRPFRVRPDFAWRCVMKFFSRFFSGRRESNLTTALERQRLGKTMPGQTGAIAASRLGFLVN